LKRLGIVGIAVIIIAISAGLVLYFNPFTPTESITFSANGINGNPQGTLLTISYNGQRRSLNYSQLPVNLFFKYGTKISYSWMNITPPILIIPAGSVAMTPDMYSMMTRYIFSSISGSIFPNLQSDSNFEITQGGSVIANYQMQYEVDFVPTTNSAPNGFPYSTPSGSISPNAGWYDANSMEAFTVSPANGYYLAQLEASNTLSPQIEGNTVITTINAPGIIEAVFNPIPMVVANAELTLNVVYGNLTFDLYNSGSAPVTNIDASGSGMAYEVNGPSQIAPKTWGSYQVAFMPFEYGQSITMNFTISGVCESQQISVPITVVSGATNPLTITSAEIINQTLSMSVQDTGPYTFTNILVGVYQGSSQVSISTPGFNPSSITPGQSTSLTASIQSAQAGVVYNVVIQGEATNGVSYFTSENIMSSPPSSYVPNIQIISVSMSSGTSGGLVVLSNVGTSGVILTPTAYIYSDSTNTLVATGMNSVTLLPAGTVTDVTINSISNSIAAGNYYIKFETTNGYGIITPPFYVS
jgi:hypothetical protein